MGSALWISLRVALVAGVLATVLGVVAGYALAKGRWRGRGLVEAVLTLPIVLPPTVLGYWLLTALGRRSPIGRAWERLTGSSIAFTLTGAVVAATISALPYVVRAARAAIESVDPHVEAAARTVGLTERRVAWHVTLPLARRSIAAGSGLGFARALGDFGATVMLAGNIPGRTQTMPVAIYDAVQSGDDGRARNLSFVLGALAVGILLAVNLLGRTPARRAGTPRPTGTTTPTADAAASPTGSSGLTAGPATADAGVSPTGSFDETGRPAIAAPTDDRTPGVSTVRGAGDVVRRGRLEVDVTVVAGSVNVASSFVAEPGITVITGASGVGKSLTLAAVAGLVRPATGTIAWAGDRWAADGFHRPTQARGVGVVFQDAALLPHRSALGNVELGLTGRRADRRAAARRWLAVVGIEHRADARPATLSGGERQRVALARALATEPSVLLLDEPFGALDALARASMRSLVRRLVDERGVTAILVTHDADDVAALADATVHLRA